MTLAPDRADVTVADYTWIPYDITNNLWGMYEQQFTGINRLAAQRHLLTQAEFAGICRDIRVRKYVAWRDEQAIGLAVITNDLDAWPLISPAFFQHRWPHHYQRKAIFYIGFICTTHVPYLYRDLIAAMYPPVIETDGIAVMDFCARNVDTYRMPDRTGRTLKRLNPAAAGARIDQQEFWAYRFDGLPL